MSKKFQYSPPSLIPKDLDTELQPIAEELDRLHENVRWSGQGQFEQLKLWRLMNYFLGVPAASLAAVAGGTGLAASRVNHATAVLALLAAGFSAALTTLNPSRRVSQAQSAANSYLDLQTAIRQFLTIDLRTQERSQARELLDKLSERRNEVNATADPPGWYAANRAKRSIEGGRQDNHIDRDGA